MDPDVLLLLEGTDPPYTTADGSKYWLDRSGWNNHCLIVDKGQYNGANAFDITHDPVKRGYVFNRAGHLDGYLYNHIRIPFLGSLTGNVGCEIVCHNQSSNWAFPTPLSITQGERAFDTNIAINRTLLVHINERNINGWDYANVTDGGERLSLTAPAGYNWNKLSFYGYGRINGVQSFSVIDNTNSASRTVLSNTTSYPLTHGMIGAVFNGIINYVKITKKSIVFEQMMKDYEVLAKKYYIKTEQGAYVPPAKDGLLACWDARSGLLQGASNGNGAYWMDQSGNNYALKAVVPGGVSGSFAYAANSRAITSTTPVYPNSGIYMELTGGIEGKYSSLTIETVSKSINGYLNFFMSILDRNNRRIVWARPNTGGSSQGVEINSDMVTDRCANYIEEPNYYNQRRSLVYTIDFINKINKIYLNGNLYQSVTFTAKTVPNPIFEINRIVLFNQESYNQAFTGEVNAFRIYNRELSASEIRTNLARDRKDFGF